MAQVEFDGRLQVGRCAQGELVVVRLPGMAVRQEQAKRLLARLHAAAVLVVLQVLWVVDAAQRCRVVRVFRVARVAAQWVPVGQLVAQRLLARRHAVAVLWGVQRVVRAAGCCRAVQTCRVHQPGWFQMLSVVVARWVGLRLASGPPL